MHKVLVVDDHPFIRSAVKALLKQEGFVVVAEADNGADAVRLAQLHRPALIILDISMPTFDGLKVINRVAGLGLPCKILVLTSQAVEFFAMRCMRAGASGFVSKGDDIEELAKAAKVIMSGYTFFPDLAGNSVRKSDVEITEIEILQSLSDREITVLQYLARGMSNKEISDVMLLSYKTVSTYKIRLVEKLKVKSLVFLADFAKRHNLI
ncbi:DNA-binding response regulator [Pseudomonas protegens]|uniref:response regulator transcription factor n=1 Tax=Pseudomonas protegens TaxID=380021 RepID=UPI000F4C7797|nr:response regulator transcription factor [Pseudomonas protegens]ROL81470.1 DNA-binding response regulator [Pseudomonas protegens]